MDKAKIVKDALKGRKSSGKAQSVKVVNTPTVKIDHSDDEMPRRMPPTLRLTTDDLAAIKNWRVGQKYKLVVEVELTGLEQGSMYEMIGGSDDKKTRANFKVKSVRTS
jgi:hypothetical protein